MIRRFAVVLWWLGCLFAAGAALGGLAALTGSKDGVAIGLPILVSLGFFWLCCWTLTFILAGSFRRPPTL